MIYFSIVLKNHLRGHINQSIFEVRSPQARGKSIINSIMELNRRGYITEVQFLTINDELTALSDILWFMWK